MCLKGFCTHSFQLRSGPAISLQGCSSLEGSPPSRPAGHSGLVFLPHTSRAEPWPCGGPPPPPAAEVRTGTKREEVRIHHTCISDNLMHENDLDMTVSNRMKLSVT